MKTDTNTDDNRGGGFDAEIETILRPYHSPHCPTRAAWAPGQTEPHPISECRCDIPNLTAKLQAHYQKKLLESELRGRMDELDRYGQHKGDSDCKYCIALSRYYRTRTAELNKLLAKGDLK